MLVINSMKFIECPLYLKFVLFRPFYITMEGKCINHIERRLRHGWERALEHDIATVIRI